MLDYFVEINSNKAAGIKFVVNEVLKAIKLIFSFCGPESGKYILIKVTKMFLCSKNLITSVSTQAL